jgi:Ca-activated chloride channel family protein
MCMSTRAIAILTALAPFTPIPFLLFSPSPAFGQGWIEIERPVLPGRPGAVVRTSSDVRVTIDGQVAQVAVAERFRNDGGGLAEGSYLYPLPGDAVFQNFSLWAGETELKGEMLNADQACRVYEEIVRRRKDPALLTLAGHRLVRAQVFPIQSGETRRIALRYTQLLTRAGDALRLRYPIGDRGTGSAFSFHVTVQHADQLGEPYSPTHRLESRREGDRFEITLTSDAGGDVELFFPFARGIVASSLIAHAPVGEDGYFMLLMAPGSEGRAQRVPRDVTLVVDVSGSMSGGKLEQAQAGLRQALGTLAPQDRFRLIAFSSAVHEFRSGLTPASPAAIDSARRFVDGLSADGGTNIAGALDAALEGPVDSSRLPIVLFLTDGLPSVGEQAPDRIAERASTRLAGRRIFTVGVGHDVNTYLLDRLAAEGRGSVEYVAPGASVETAIGSITTRIRHPALVNRRIESAPVGLTDLTPSQVPDLFQGEELVLLGRYRGHGSGDLVITGERSGSRERFVVRADFPKNRSEDDYIPRLWASRRVGDLTRQMRLEGESAELVERVRDLGLRYGILTEYTSYLVQEPEALASDPRGRPVLQEDASRIGGAANADRETGQLAFRRAEQSAKLAQAKSLDAAAEAAPPTASLGSLAGPASATRTAAGRVFFLRGNVWTDAGHLDTLQVMTVASFSDAYFSLVRALPELTECLRLGDEVLIAGRRVSLRIGHAGLESWQQGQLERVVRDFRGVGA